MARFLHDDPDMAQFIGALTNLLNAHNIDNLTNTPDYILARYLVAQIRTWDKHLVYTRGWHQWPTLAERLGLTPKEE